MCRVPNSSTLSGQQGIVPSQDLIESMQVVESVASPDQKVKPLGGPSFEMGMGQRYQTENISKPRSAKQLHIHALAYSS